MTRAVVALSILLSALLAAAADVAWWKPYGPADDDTWLLEHFDEPVADAELVPGKFGKALRGVVRLDPAALCTGGVVAIEAWIKLDAYPEDLGYILDRPAVVDRNVFYNPEVDLTKGFSLAVDSAGALVLTTTGVGRGRPVRTATEAGAVPLGEWVHVAGIHADFPTATRTLYVNGAQLAWHGLVGTESLLDRNADERQPGPVWIGGDSEGGSRLPGAVDEVRVHRGIVRFWPRPEQPWLAAAATRAIPAGPPVLAPEHQPLGHVAADPDEAGLGGEPRFVPGVRGAAVAGNTKVETPAGFDCREGSFECWFQLQDIDNVGRGRYHLLTSRLFQLRFTTRGLTGIPAPLELRVLTDFSLTDRDLTPLRPDEWHHVVVTWAADGTVVLYLDGREAGRDVTHERLLDEVDHAIGAINLNQYGDVAAFDEFYFYGRPLSATEAANCYWRYRDPARQSAVGAQPLRLTAWYLPTPGHLYYRLTPTGDDRPATVFFTLANDRQEVVLRRQIANPDYDCEGLLELPALDDGEYTIAVATDADAPAADRRTFQRRHFAWEGNDLGKETTVYPPFTPLEVDGTTVRAVGRAYELGALGLPAQIVSLGKPLLAAPVCLRLGDIAWRDAAGAVTTATGSLVVYDGHATSDPVAVALRSEIEEDGGIRCILTLTPGPRPAGIDSLTLDIPLRADVARHLNVYTDGNRRNDVIVIPAGAGRVWDGTQANRRRDWLNPFVSYLWLGYAERGLAWWADNDRDWVTQKGDAAPSPQEILRAGDIVTLRIHLVNESVRIDRPHEIVFGLQASPVKPMPENWRGRIGEAPGGLSVYPWGGVQCADKGPIWDAWDVVDKILEGRRTGEPDLEWFHAWDREHNPPPVFGTRPWLVAVDHFATYAGRSGLDHPLSIYHEEMAVSTAIPDWWTYQDEWADRILSRHDWPDREIFYRGHRVQPHHDVSFPDSYQDYALWYANEWLRRGVGIYWDRTWPKPSTNYRVTAAYRLPDGRVQPAVCIWNQRRYQQRLWQLTGYWRTRRPEPLYWTMHKSGVMLTCLHGYSHVSLDGEIPYWGRLVNPEYLLENAAGLQTGVFPLYINPAYGVKNDVVRPLDPVAKYEIDWAMRMVHEIRRNPVKGQLQSRLPGGYVAPEDVVTRFGYGTDRVVVHNYWADDPVLDVANDQVRWIVLERPVDGALLIVLASWSADAQAVRATLTLNAGALVPARADTPAPAPTAGGFALDLPAPYGSAILVTEGALDD